MKQTFTLKNIVVFKIFSVLLLSLLIFPATSFAATPSISTSETVANVAAGTDDQTDVTTATTANVSEVKASRTLTVGALPGNNETITIGTCVVTYASSTGATNDELNCTDNAAAIDRDTGAGNTARSATDIAGIMRTLTNVSDTGHGALTITGSGAEAIFTTTGTETSATAITFTDGTTGDITSTASTTGVIPVAQVNTITIAGTVDTGDVFTATLPTVGAVTYTVTSSDTTTANIATGLNAAIQASSGYASQAFTSAASSNTVVLTAKTAGTGFTQTSSAANRAAVAQVVVFTPSNVESNYRYTITINGTGYSSDQTSNVTAQSIVEALQPLVDGSSAVSCTEDNAAITCTASSAGTAFTYSTSVSQLSSGSSGGTSASGRVRNLVEMGNCTLALEIMNQYPNGSGMASQRQYYQQKCGVASVVQQPVVPSIAPNATLGRTLAQGATGDDVSLVQRWLAQDATIYPEGLITGYFGSLTLSAVQKFQVKHSIVADGEAGYGIVGPRTQSKLLELYGGTSVIGVTQTAVPSNPSIEQTATSFIRGLSKGMFGEDVRLLQQFLNKNPETQVVATGDGSPGNETTYFGTLTEVAVQKFQMKHSIASEGDSGYGVVGPMTIAKLIELQGE